MLFGEKKKLPEATMQNGFNWLELTARDHAQGAKFH